MPIYAYKCDSCAFQKDVLQKVSDPVLSTCPSCGAESFRKQVTAAGFQLKGSGWYVTDFRGGSQQPAKPEAAADKSAPADTASAEASKAADAPSPAPVAAATPAAAPPAGSTGD
jgi:putative FmdB family regulatory protein